MEDFYKTIPISDILKKGSEWAITKERVGLEEKGNLPSVIRLCIKNGAVTEHVIFELTEIIEEYYGKYKSTGYSNIKLYILPNLLYKKES